MEPMVQLADGSFELPEESIVSRAVAVDRTRAITYKLTAKLADYSDPNKTADKDPNKTASEDNKIPTTSKSSQTTDEEQK